MQKFKIRYTYQVVTPESAKHGDCAESGWAYDNGCNLETYGPDFDDRCEEVLEFENWDEFVDHVSEKIGSFETDSSPGRLTEGSLYATDPDLNYETGAETYYAVHYEMI